MKHSAFAKEQRKSLWYRLHNGSIDKIHASKITVLGSELCHLRFWATAFPFLKNNCTPGCLAIAGERSEMPLSLRSS